MKEYWRFTEPSLDSGRGSGDKVTSQHLDTSNVHEVRSPFREATQESNDWAALHTPHGSHRLQFGVANEIDQTYALDIGFDTNEITAHGFPPSQYTAQLTSRTKKGPLYDIDHSFPVKEPSIVPMPPGQLSASRHSSTLPHPPSQHYGPFLGRFSNSEDAKTYRRDKMRFGRMPWRDPDSDPTIAETENNRDFHVERIYNAMICGDYARDNANSTALKRWVYGAHYQSDLVEAYAHKVFDCLLEQVKKGFRGWHQNDYVNDERKGDDDDKDMDCAGRLNNVITALQQEKSICENVMSSAWQIRMFVNAPKAYAKRKDQNRVGNSKRPNTKMNEGAEQEPHRLKRLRNTAAIRSKQVQDDRLVAECRLTRGMTPQRQYQRQVQPASDVSPDMNTTSPTLSICSPYRSYGYPLDQQANPMPLSPTSLQPPLPSPRQDNLEHITPMPAIPQPLFSLPALLPRPQGHLSESSTCGGIGQEAITPCFKNWHDSTHVDLLPRISEQLEAMGHPVAGDGKQDAQLPSPYEAPRYSNIFEYHAEKGVCLSDIERALSHGINEELHGDFFERYWEQQMGGQQSLDNPEQQKYH